MLDVGISSEVASLFPAPTLSQEVTALAKSVALELAVVSELFLSE